jgi:hypothetical protein
MRFLLRLLVDASTRGCDLEVAFVSPTADAEMVPENPNFESSHRG